MNRFYMVSVDFLLVDLALTKHLAVKDPRTVGCCAGRAVDGMRPGELEDFGQAPHLVGASVSFLVKREDGQAESSQVLVAQSQPSWQKSLVSSGACLTGSASGLTLMPSSGSHQSQPQSLHGGRADP